MYWQIGANNLEDKVIADAIEQVFFLFAYLNVSCVYETESDTARLLALILA